MTWLFIIGLIAAVLVAWLAIHGKPGGGGWRD